ncbi:transmembrane protein 74 [Microcaecilia unicolor]|uniref:Transmembrane protein 74-like n=1 Tax=Microcaecilia unicolor TaxID=1415580 RepID=A0A6P7Y4V7_9AMPH|nr:transmembrane protein 74-like [Microcaecilia unicolor]
MACLELLHLAKGEGQFDQYHRLDRWCTDCRPEGRDRPGRATCCCQSTQRLSTSGVTSSPAPPCQKYSAVWEETRHCLEKEPPRSSTHLDHEGINLEAGSTAQAEVQPSSAPIPPHQYLLAETQGRSVDYGFVSAVIFLLSGALLVIVSHAVSREVRKERDEIPAREMERLVQESARLGAHLDRCVLAGICLLTLGAVLLATLLMRSLWEGEVYRRKRRAALRESAKLYGSFSFRMGSGAGESVPELFIEGHANSVQNTV